MTCGTLLDIPAWRRLNPAHSGELAACWSAAAAAAPSSVFQTWAFARHWLQAFRDDSDFHLWAHPTAPLLLPWVVRQRRLSFVGEGLFDYLDPIGVAAPDWQPPAAALPLANADLGLQCTAIRASSPFLPFWRVLASASGAALEDFSAAPLRASSAVALAREHPRYAGRWRRAAASGVELHLECDPRARLRLLDWILERKASRLAAQGADNVLGPREQAWLRAVVAREPELSELWCLRRGAAMLSGLLCWRFLRVRYGYTISYEQQAAELSPGVLLLYAVVARTMEQNWSFDFLTGEQPFKHRFASDHERLLRMRSPSR